MTPAERSALVRSAIARERGGMALFTCPRWPGSLKLRPQTCGESYQRRALANKESPDYVRLQPCAGCPVGESNVGEKRKAVPVKVGSFGQVQRVPSPELIALTEKVLRANPGMDAQIAADAMKVSRATAHTRLCRLEAEGRARRESVNREAARWWPV